VSALPSLVNAITLAAAAPSAARFTAALRDPAEAQRRILLRLLDAGRDTAYGRALGFASIRTAEDYAARVPFVDFDALAPWMARVEQGERGVLTCAPVRFMEPTGGSSGYRKLVPYTDTLRAEFSAATMPWLFDLLTRRPALARGRAYWAITPPAREAQRTAGGVPIGMQDDADYFPRPLRALLRQTLAVPSSVAQSGDVATCRRRTLVALLGAPDLTLISVWSPSFLTTLTTTLDEEWSGLLDELEHGAFGVTPRPDVARALQARFGQRAPDDLGLVWPQLTLVSCWMGGHAARSLPGVRARFPRVELQGKGLLATEGVVSFPLFDAEAPVAAITSHYLELLASDGRVVPIHRADIGGTYEVALTTGGGLYRYRLRDLVRVEAIRHRTPMLSFQGRADRASDLAGEKLTPALAERAIADALRRTKLEAPFAMLAPSLDPTPHYRLYVDLAPEQAERLAAATEEQLCGAHHYALCRALGQLGTVRGVSARDAHRTYERACVARGQRAGAIKPPALECALGWEEAFEARREVVLQ
jgi:hypothetical protein